MMWPPNWAEEIDQHLNTAQIILLLISPSLMASEYCYSKEIKRALERHNQGEAHVIPVIFRPVDWIDAPFGNLQCLPTNAKPVTDWRNRGKAFLDIALGIKKIVTDLLTSTPDISKEAIMKSWFIAGSHPRDYEQGIDSSVTYSGKSSGYLKAKMAQPRGFSTLMQIFKADYYRNKRMRLSAAVKSEGLEDWAGLWMRIDGPGRKSLGFDNMKSRPIKGTTDWQKYEVVLDVPQESVSIAFGILLRGKGQAWLSDLQFGEVQADVPVTSIEYPDQPENLDFGIQGVSL
jgi:TIR domain